MGGCEKWCVATTLRLGLYVSQRHSRWNGLEGIRDGRQENHFPREQKFLHSDMGLPLNWRNYYVFERARVGAAQKKQR